MAEGAVNKFAFKNGHFLYVRVWHPFLAHRLGFDFRLGPCVDMWVPGGYKSLKFGFILFGIDISYTTTDL